MLKFLRKYQTILLVIGGCFLMVVFVAPQAVQQFGPNPMNAQAASIGGAKVTQGELDRAGRERAALERWNPFITDGLLNLEDEDDHWLLLKRAAEEGEYIGGTTDALAWIPELADQLTVLRYGAQGVSNPEQVLQIPAIADESAQLAAQLMGTRAAAAATAGFTEAEFDELIAAARGVKRMADQYEDLIRFGDQRFRQAMRRFDDSAFASVAWLRALTVLDEVEDPAEAELQAHFDKYREQNPADNEYGIGYNLGPRARFEYLILNYEDILEAVVVSEMDIARHYRINQERFGPDRDAVREGVIAELRLLKTQEAFNAADRAIRTVVLGATRNLPTDAEGVHVAPATWPERPTIDQLAAAAQEAMTGVIGIDAPFPQIGDTGSDFINRARFEDTQTYPDFEGLALATVRAGSQQVPFFDAVRSVPQIESNTTLEVRLNIPAIEYFATMSDDPRFQRGYNNNRVYFTTLAARDTSPAESLDAVRDLVERDLKQIKALEILDSRIEEYTDFARENGARALAERLNPRVETDPITGRMLDAEGVPIDVDPSVQFSRRVIRSYFDALSGQTDLGVIALEHAVEHIGPLERSEFIAPEHRVLALRSENPPGYFVLDFIGYRPALQTRARGDDRGDVLRAAAFEEFSDALYETPVVPPLSLIGLADRYGYRNEDLDLDERRAEALERIEDLAENLQRGFGRSVDDEASDSSSD
ncbi:MAG: hypothetical protein AAGB51_06480 [Planctomycetota bacterium]